MCGVAGILNLTENQPVQVDQLQRMLASIRHRGPDGVGIYRDADAGLGNVRLGIIDLSTGDQPIGNEDGTCWIVYNGEVFNYVELRPGLEQRGHIFSTHTDTEVILHLYEEEGPACLQRLNGQFALAIWDARRRSLFLARDRVGIRPLFYAIQGGQLVFGSEVKAILASGLVEAAIDLQALRDVFTYWSAQPPKSIFKGIQELPPGHYMLVEDGRVHIQPYWQLDLQPETPERGTQECLEELESLLIDATRIRLRADVPVAAYLSGGLDSSLTTALIRGYTKNRLDTFSIAFSDPLFDESAFQWQMADHLGTDHHVIYCDYADISRAFPEVIWHTETPILRTAPVPMFLLSQLVREHCFKVVMTGEGADEFLAGYDIFKEMKIRRFWAADPSSKIRPLLLSRLYPDIRGMGASSAFLTGFFQKDLEQTASPFYSHLIRWRNTSRTWRFFREGSPANALNTPQMALPEHFADWPPLSQAQYLEVTTFLSPYLLSSQGDRMAMAHSVEGRYPFLDYRVIEFCNRLPSEMKMPVLMEKWLLKKLGSKYLPDTIWRRGKRPYRAPIHRSFFSPRPPDYVTEMLSPQSVQETGFFEPGAVQKLFSKATAASDGGSGLSEVEDMALVGILSTQLLHAQFVRGMGVAESPNGSPNLKIIDRLEESR
jgi:asparagine synthase (glutamine-hydrolysing)